MKKTGVNRHCTVCNKEFYVPKWKLERGEGKYCSWSCHNIKRKEYIPWNKGLPRDEETKKKISKKLIGIKTGRSPMRGKKQSPETISKRVQKLIGQKRSIEVRKKFSEIRKGKNSPFWRGGISKINKDIRHSLEYRIWREAVFERDNYTCQNCKKRGGYLEADHIKPFSLYIELRFVVSNGRTLCKKCHKEIGWRISNRDSNGRFVSI